MLSDNDTMLPDFVALLKTFLPAMFGRLTGYILDAIGSRVTREARKTRERAKKWKRVSDKLHNHLDLTTTYKAGPRLALFVRLVREKELLPIDGKTLVRLRYVAFVIETGTPLVGRKTTQACGELDDWFRRFSRSVHHKRSPKFLGSELTMRSAA